MKKPTKSIATYRKPKRDLRALELTALAKVRPKERRKVRKAVRPKTAATISELKDEFRKALSKDVTAYTKGKITHTIIIRRSVATFRSAYYRAFQVGLKAQGVGTKTYVTTHLTQADINWLDKALSSELGFWQRFMRDIKANRLHMPMVNRLEMYVQALESVFTAGRVQGSPDLAIVSWIFGEAEHCPECVLLERFSPFTKATLPTTPRAGDTRCLTHCKCKIVIRNVPNHIYTAIKKRQHSKMYFLSVLRLSRKNLTSVLT